MPDVPSASPKGDKAGRTAGWYVLLLAWLVYAGAYFAFSKSLVKPAADITNYQLLDIAGKYGAFVGVGIGLVTFLVTGLVYLILRFFLKKGRRFAAFLLTFLGYAPWLVFGYDLVYREPRYAEVARVIITYAGQPMLYAAAVVCGAAFVGAVLALVFTKRSK